MTEDFKFRTKSGDSPAYSNCPEVDVLSGYIDPRGMLENKSQAEETSKAIELVNKFLSQAIKQQTLILK
jgi:hypothetical protein